MSVKNGFPASGSKKLLLPPDEKKKGKKLLFFKFKPEFSSEFFDRFSLYKNGIMYKILMCN